MHPPYLQTSFAFFSNFDSQFLHFFSFSLKWIEPYIGVKISKLYFFHSFGLISTIFNDKYVSHSGN